MGVRIGLGRIDVAVNEYFHSPVVDASVWDGDSGCCDRKYVANSELCTSNVSTIGDSGDDVTIGLGTDSVAGQLVVIEFSNIRPGAKYEQRHEILTKIVNVIVG